MKQKASEFWWPVPPETSVILLLLSDLFFFMFRHNMVWVALTMPCIVLLYNVMMLTLTFLIDKNFVSLLRYAATDFSLSPFVCSCSLSLTPFSVLIILMS